MKAPTVETYQQYVLFRRAARAAVENARLRRKLHALGFHMAANDHKLMSKDALISARFHWRQVELMEV